MGTVYTSLQFKLWATIGGADVDLVMFNCSYEMNTIPTCRATLPVGYRVLPPHLPSAAHMLTGGINVQIPLVVYCDVKYCGGQYQPTLPSTGTYILFQGYVTGVGYMRQYDGYSMSIEGVHWLSNLSYSSIMSENSSPQNPTEFTFNAALFAAAGGGKGCLPITSVQVKSTEANVKSDLWGKVIQPWFLDLAAKNRINRQQLANLDVNPNNDTKNNDVSQTLRKIDGEKLPFDTKSFGVGATIATMIGKELACTQQPTIATAERMAQQTFWDKIVGELKDTYMFSVIPFPTTAKVIPFIPGLRDVWDPAGEGFTFKGRDIVVQDGQAQLPRQLRAVCVYAGMADRCGAAMPPGAGVNNWRVGGAYVGADSGMVLMRAAPAFLRDTKLQHAFTGHVTKIRGNAFNHPGAGDAPPDPKPENTSKDARNMMDSVAHAWYVTEVLKNRYGDLSTPIRFDVAPGSSVKIEGTSGTFSSDGEARYGQVTSVMHMFDAQQQRCGSSFRIAHMHNEAEHQQDQFTIDQHPYYTTTWPGARHITPG